jgi:hypothetical protein
VPLGLPKAHICFAASGDLRNVIATVNRLPMGYQASLFPSTNLHLLV